MSGLAEIVRDAQFDGRHEVNFALGRLHLPAPRQIVRQGNTEQVAVKGGRLFDDAAIG